MIRPPFASFDGNAPMEPSRGRLAKMNSQVGKRSLAGRRTRCSKSAGNALAQYLRCLQLVRRTRPTSATMPFMRGYVATTDFTWFTFLRARQPLDEVNFWQPSAHGFNAKPGTPFFFKLKAPHYAIGGFGIFARYEEASPTLAWEAFGAEQRRGDVRRDAQACRELRARSQAQPGHRVGCVMVSQPVFFADGEWVEQPKDWHKNVVSGAGYDLSSRAKGSRIWEECRARVAQPFR